MRIKKLAGGGFPAFVSYINVEQALPAYAGIGSSSSSDISSKSSSSSSKGESKSGDIGLLSKEMQKILMENGLPSDVRYLLSKVDVFGNNIDPLDPHSQERIYSKLLSIIPEIKTNKAAYDDAAQHAREKGTIDSVAIASNGGVYVLKENGQVGVVDAFTATKNGMTKLTNGQLLQYRAFEKPMDQNIISNVVSSSISIQDITDNVIKIIDKVGKDSVTQEGFTRKDSKSQKMSDAISKLIDAGEDGVYKITSKKITSDQNAQYLLDYILAKLQPNEKGVLENIAASNGLDKKNGVRLILTQLIRGQLDNTVETQVSFDNQATKGATNDTGEKISDINGITSTVASRFFAGYGDNQFHTFRSSEGNAAYLAYGNSTFVPDPSGNPMGKQLTLSDLSKSGLNGGLDLTQASFGGIPLSTGDDSKIMIDGDKIIAVELPYEIVNGKIVPQIDKMNVISRILQDSQDLIEQGNFQAVNQKFRQAGLTDYFTSNGSTTNSYKRFAVVQGFTDENVVDNGTSIYNITGEYSDANDYEIGTVVSFLKNRNKKEGIKDDPSKPTLLGIGIPFTSENIVKGMVFIPINENATTWYQNTMKEGQAYKLEEASQIRQSQIDTASRYKPSENPF